MKYCTLRETNGLEYSLFWQFVIPPSPLPTDVVQSHFLANPPSLFVIKKLTNINFFGTSSPPLWRITSLNESPLCLVHCLLEHWTCASPDGASQGFPLCAHCCRLAELGYRPKLPYTASLNCIHKESKKIDR